MKFDSVSLIWFRRPEVETNCHKFQCWYVKLYLQYILAGVNIWQHWKPAKNIFRSHAVSSEKNPSCCCSNSMQFVRCSLAELVSIHACMYVLCIYVCVCVCVCVCISPGMSTSLSLFAWAFVNICTLHTILLCLCKVNMQGVRQKTRCNLTRKCVVLDPSFVRK